VCIKESNSLRKPSLQQLSLTLPTDDSKLTAEEIQPSVEQCVSNNLNSIRVIQSDFRFQIQGVDHDGRSVGQRHQARFSVVTDAASIALSSNDV
jgi:hypothetical protein